VTKPVAYEDIRTRPAYVRALEQVVQLTAARPLERIVEIGSASGRVQPGQFLMHLHNATGLSVIGSDASAEGLDVAREAARHVAFIHADAMTIVRREASPTTLIVAMNQIGKLSPAEAQMFFDGIRGAITFSERGVLAKEAAQRDRDRGWDHDYAQLLRGFELIELAASPTPKFPEREAIIATAYRA